MEYVVIGNSAAGVNAIEAIRKADEKGRIVNIADEPYLPYSRPLLSYLVAGKVDEERIYIRPKTFYRDHRVEPILGDEVVEVDSKKQWVVLKSGKKIYYDRLLVATGRKPVKLPIPGLEGEGVYPLTSLDHARGILSCLPDTKEVLVIGSGLIGLKSAEALRIRGLDVTVVEIAERIMPFATDARASEFLQHVMEENGIKFHLRTSVDEIERVNGKIVGARLSNGERIPCQLVILAAGLRPVFNFLKGTEARVNIGVIVDNYMQTTEPNIYAAGDVTESKDVITGMSNLSAVWPRASEQGYTAGYNMAGFKKEYIGGYGMNSVSFFGISCISVGDIFTEKPHYEILVKEIPEEYVYHKIILENDVVRGAITVGRFINMSAMNRLIRKRVKVGVYKENLLEEKFIFAY